MFVIYYFIVFFFFNVGGSNDQSYCNAKGFMNFYKDERIGVINLDAHFDVRPLKEGKAHSGSPFRQLLEDPKFQEKNGVFIEFASKGCSTSYNHYTYLLENKCDIYWLEKNIRRFPVSEKAIDCQVVPNYELKTQAGQLMFRILKQLSDTVDKIFFSFDIDSIDSQFCPGVSAPSVVGGLTEQEAIELCFLAGQNKKVGLIDFSEYNPAVESHRTGRLLANMVYEFCRGVSYR